MQKQFYIEIRKFKTLHKQWKIKINYVYLSRLREKKYPPVAGAAPKEEGSETLATILLGVHFLHTSSPKVVLFFLLFFSQLKIQMVRNIQNMK